MSYCPLTVIRHTSCIFTQLFRNFAFSIANEHLAAYCINKFSTERRRTVNGLFTADALKGSHALALYKYPQYQFPHLLGKYDKLSLLT